MNHLLLNEPGFLAAMLATKPQVAQDRLDDVDPDMVADASQSYALRSISMQAAAAVQTWCETTPEDLGEGEGMSDRLVMLLVGVADQNKDGELDEAEQAIVETAMTEAWSYMASKGVANDDLDTLFNSDDPEAANAAAARVCEFISEKLPDGEEASEDDIDDFAFGADAQASVFDAVYKKRFAIRQGKKVTIRKRISGVVRLSAKQKLAIRKAGMKAHGARATFKRMKSLRVRKAMGLGGRR
jgi:hypothetical protein